MKRFNLYQINKHDSCKEIFTVILSHYIIHPWRNALLRVRQTRTCGSTSLQRQSLRHRNNLMILAFILACIALPLSSFATDTDNELNYKAIVIGINDYQHDDAHNWANLHTAANDARSIADLLENKYDFDVTRLLNGEATRSAIIQSLDDVAQCSPNDAVLIYYAGHGFYDKDIDEGFWIPVDAQSTINGRNARQDWIWNSVITRMIDASQARHVLVISDSCYSGSLFRGPIIDHSSRKDAIWYFQAMSKTISLPDHQR